MAFWLAAAGAFVVSLDSMMNIAFPSIAAGFAMPAETMRWVIICYVGVYALMSFAGGAAADLLGHVRVFRVGAALSAVALLAGGVVTEFGWLLGARLLQGFAGGLVYGTAPGIVTLAALPERRGRALGLLNAAMALGFALGPLAAGVLVDAFGWRAVFHARWPLAALVFLMALVVPAARVGASGTRRLVGFADLGRPPVPSVCALAFLANAAIFAIWLLVPFYLVERRGFSTAVSGLIFTLTPLGTTLAAPLAGRVGDRIGPAFPLIAGLVLEALGLATLAFAGVDTPVIVVGVGLFAAGFGVGLFQVPMMTLIMSAFPPTLQGAAGGVAFLSRTLGIVSGVAVLAAILSARRAAVGFDGAFTEAFMVATALVVVAALFGAARARRFRSSVPRA